MIQWRNLNIDPDAYTSIVPMPAEKPMGMRLLLERVKSEFPELMHGTLNPPRERWPSTLVSPS
jgi:hypothetical protein